MVTISTVDAQALFTKKLLDVYQERPKPTQFLKSFFRDTPPTDTLELSIMVQRGSEKVAVDVLRGTDGNRNQFTKSTEKIWIPPYYREYFERTQMSAYEVMFRGTEVSSAAFSRLINSTADHIMALTEKIDRRKELQAAQILIDGFVTLKAGESIDFKRKAGSKVDLSATPWSTGATNVFSQIQAACDWVRKNGKVTTFRFNMICGSDAITDLYANTTFLGRQDLVNMRIDTVAVPQKNAEGGVYHATITAGPYIVDVWSYPAEYEDPDNSNTLTPYIDPKKIVILPINANLIAGYAMVPQLLEPGEQPQIGQVIVSEYKDPKARTREFHVESAPLLIPVAIDTIYTAKVKA